MASAKQGAYAQVSEESTETAIPISAVEPFDEKVERFEVSQTWAKGEVQEDGYKDVYFAVAFYVQLAVMIGAAFLFAIGVIETATDSDDNDLNRKLSDYMSNNNNNKEDSDGLSDEDGEKLLSVVVLSLVLSPILAVLVLGLIREHAVLLIKSSLWFNIGLSVALCLASLVSAPPAAFFYGLLTLVLVCYAKRVWHRIPYAASNLRCAVTAIKANLGIALLSFAAVPFKVGWIFLWGYTLYKTMQTEFMKDQVEEEEEASSFNAYDDLTSNGTTETLSAAGTVVILLFSLSLYWTSEVIKNTIHTTIAGVIGTWWFLPEEASSFCSKGLTDSFARSTTYSFGSICFGSLIVAILEVIKNSLRSAQNNRNSILRCIAFCLLAWIERLVEYFNKWAFVYVGLYGYSYMEAGKNVITLFRARGWSTIISDNLVYRMLGMMCLAIGLFTGLIGFLFALSLGFSDSGLLAFAVILSILTGIVMSGLMMSAVGSSVDSIIVLYCEAPAEFEANHPELHREMQSTWTNAWSSVFLAQAEVVPEANVV